MENAGCNLSEKRVKKQVINISSRKPNLKRGIRRHLRKIGFHKTTEGALAIEGSGKDVIRALHESQRHDLLEKNREFITRRAPVLLKHFATGQEVQPHRISPVLDRIRSGTWQSELFRLASLTWSVPVSNGFGRRLRYLVWDGNNHKLLGLIAIGDPVFNLSVRDDLIGWNVHDRGARLVNVMDAYVLGALPPYNTLLGGKLIACLVRTREVYEDFARTYGGTTGIISQKKKDARLLAVTTSSSLGRSSVYNRLNLNGVQYFKSIGYTAGWGHFHIPDRLFTDLRNYLREIEHPYADLHRFGNGPNWRLRTVRAALKELGLKGDLLRHGIQREVFLCLLASNAKDLLRTGQGQPDLASLLDAGGVSQFALDRWIIPRSQRRTEYRSWGRENLLELLSNRSHDVEARLTTSSGRS